MQFAVSDGSLGHCAVTRRAPSVTAPSTATDGLAATIMLLVNSTSLHVRGGAAPRFLNVLQCGLTASFWLCLLQTTQNFPIYADRMHLFQCSTVPHSTPRGEHVGHQLLLFYYFYYS